MYRLIFDGSQAAFLVHAKAINICSNDSLRNMFVNFLSEELGMYDSLLKFGKLKGWVDTPPSFKH